MIDEYDSGVLAFYLAFYFDRHQVREIGPVTIMVLITQLLYSCTSEIVITLSKQGKEIVITEAGDAMKNEAPTAAMHITPSMSYS